MSAKDNKTFDKMMKKFFSLYKNTPGSLRRQEDFVLSSELEKELSSETPIAQRVKTLKDLTKTDNITSCPIDDHVVARLWEILKDLLDPAVPKESRHVVFHFFRALINEKHEKINVMRSQFFKVIKSHNIPEDIGPRLELFQSLTNNGKFLLTFEEGVGIFLLEWMPEIIDAGRTHDVLKILVNVIKYNAAFIEESVVAGLVQSTCNVCCQSPDDNIVYSSLEVLHTVVCYPSLPLEALPPFIATLCRTVNIERYCPTSWKIMKNLLGTHLGHSSLFTMCRLLQDENSLGDVGLLRGAVFYINMALWGNHRVSALKCTPSSVLPAFQAALACKHSRVMYEVILSIQRLVNKHGHELLDPAWYVILTIINLILQHLDEKNKTDSKDIPCLDLVLSHLHETLNLIEHLMEVGQFNGSIQTVYEIIEQCSSSRPEASVLKLLAHLSSGVDPRKDQWFENLHSLMNRFFKHEARPNIRIKVLSILSNVIKNNGLLYEDKMIAVVKKYLAEVGYDPDLAVRVAASNLLFDLCLTCQSYHVLPLMDIMEQIIFRVFKTKEGVDSEEAAADIKGCAYGLVEVFKQFLYHWDPAPSLKAFSLITTHLKNHYSNVTLLSNATSIRLMMLECMLELRADKRYRIGLKNKNRYSMYVVSSSGAQNAQDKEKLPILPVHMAVEAIVSSIKNELDWKILLLVLQELPQLLRNKALLISKNGSEVYQIANALCAMVIDKNVFSPDRLKNTPPKFTRSDLHSYVFPVLASLVSYHVHLEPTLQQRIIKCFEYGLATKSAGLCVLALTLCTLEMRDAMVKLLPEVLLNLSKISATVTTAIPILEFLSTLTQLPNVFANFVVDQYMSVFAIALPYTNLFKYTHYTVSLAHHVIAAWFLKCRLPFRRDFVKFIINHLKGNLLPPSEEASMKLDMVNEDSSNRKRSSSLTEQGSRRRERPSRMELKSSPHDENMLSFHRELTETCLDLMALYTFANVSPITKRQRTAETLLNEGQSMTWLVGNKVVTVTTSGCTLKALKHGLCDRCLKRCRIETDQVPSPSADSNDDKKKTFTHPESKTDGSSRLGDVDQDTQSTVSQDLITPKIDLNEKKERLVCACWCQGWAEIHIRRPTGTMSWMMRIQNETEGGGHSLSDLSHSDVSSLFLPNQPNPISALRDIVSERVCSEPVSIPGSPVRRTSLYAELDDIEFEVNGKSRNPVRRSNSSPEMSASWKSPLALENESSNEGKKKQNYNKDHRLNCEAIPEEMGTTPPTCEALMLAPMDHVDTKPPVPISPRMYKGDDIGRTSKGGGYRERGHTISVMSPIRKPSHWDHRPNSPRTKETKRSGVNPAFVFLQLYYSTHFGSLDKRPILLPSHMVSCLENLDWIPPYEIHKIGVLYVGPGQVNSEADILRNQYGSVRYAEFLQRLGTLISLKEADRQHIYLGGLEVNGNDGKFAYIWHDDVMQVVFHIATLMPNPSNDPNCYGKKRHIGNNLVTIVYNDSGEEYNYQTVKAQFNFAVVIVEPLDFGTNVVRIKAKEELIQQLCHNEYKIVSDQSAAVLARQLAIHTNLAALILSPLNQSRGSPYASNWLERLRWIKRTQAKLEGNMEPDSRSTARLLHFKRSTCIDEFTDYT